MSVYKVPQDVEAEDKLIGSLTFKRAIFAGVMIAALGVAYMLRVIPPQWVWSVIPLPIAAVFGTLAFFPSKDQPVEVVLAAKIRFMLKPRLRIWDQRGVKQLVTVTVPKHIERHMTKGYTEDQVSSRLTALAKTLDSRGWAVKNVSLNTFSQPAYASGPSDQRLISPVILPQAAPTAVDVRAADDIMDHTSNPVAQHFDQMMNRAAEAQRRQAIDRMHQASQERPAFTIPEPPQQPPMMPSAMLPVPPHAPPASHTGRHAVGNPDNAGYATFGATTLQAPDETVSDNTAPPNADEEEFLAKVRKKQSGSAHPNNKLKRIKTPKEIESEEKERRKEAEAAARAAVEKAEIEDAGKQAETSPDPSNPAILELANNDDLNIATLARQAKVATDKQDDGEVVISLR